MIPLLLSVVAGCSAPVATTVESMPDPLAASPTAAAPPPVSVKALARRPRPAAPSGLAAGYNAPLVGGQAAAPTITTATQSGPLLPWQTSLGAGVTRWDATPGSTQYDIAMGSVTDSASNYIVAGGFSNTFDPGCGAMTMRGTYDMYVAKYAPDGTCLWAAQFSGTNDTYATAIAIDSSDNLYVTGSFNGSTNLGGGAISSEGGYDGFVLSLDSSGAYRWANGMGGTGDDYPGGVAVSSTGTVAVAGGFPCSAHFGDPRGGSLTSNGDYDAFVAEYSSTVGRYLSSLSFGGAGYDSVNAMAFSGSDVIVTGTFAQTVDFGDSQRTSAGEQDGFVHSISATGVANWTATFGGTTYDSSYGLSVDANGASYVTGYFEGSASFGGATPLTTNTIAGYVVQYDASGNFGWATAIDAGTSTIGSAVLNDGQGNVWVTGAYAGTLSGIPSVGSQDAFLMSFSSATGAASSWIKTYGAAGTVWPMTLTTDGFDIFASGSFDNQIDLGAGVVTSKGSSDVFNVAASKN